MKVYHIVCGRPIGPTWEAYLEKPELYRDPFDAYGTWIEEIEVAELAAKFANHMEYAKANFPESYWPYELKIAVRCPPPDPMVQAQMDQDWEDYCGQASSTRQSDGGL